MARPPNDPQHDQFEYRPGVNDFTGWEGVVSEGDPGSIPNNALRRLLNGRFEGPNVVGRKGLIEVTELGTFQRVAHIAEIPCASPRIRIYKFFRGCNVGAVIGFQLDGVDEESGGDFSLAYESGSSYAGVGAAFGDKFYVADFDVIRQLIIPHSYPDGYGSSSTSGLVQLDLPVETFSGFEARSIAEFDGKIFIGLKNIANPATQSKIVAYDGITFTDDLTGISTPFALGVFRNRLIVAQNGQIQWRAAGTPPGSWTAVVNADFLIEYSLGKLNDRASANCIMEYRDQLWFAGRDNASGLGAVWSWDDTALTLEWTIAASVQATCLTIVEGNALLYGWVDDTPEFKSAIGRYDPDNAIIPRVDTYKDLSTDWTPDGFTYITSMTTYRTRVFIGGLGHSSTDNSPLNGDLQAAWTGGTSEDPTESRVYTGFVVF